MSSSPESHGVQAAPSHAASHDLQTAPHDHGQDTAHDHAVADAGPRFTEQEWKEFRDDDIHAGGAVICLMAGIFTIGLMLYTTIAIIVGA